MLTDLLPVKTLENDCSSRSPELMFEHVILLALGVLLKKVAGAQKHKTTVMCSIWHTDVLFVV